MADPRSPGFRAAFFVGAPPANLEGEEALFGAGGYAAALTADGQVPANIIGASGNDFSSTFGYNFIGPDDTFTGLLKGMIRLGCVEASPLEESVDEQETTCYGDREKVYVPGFSEFSLNLDLIADIRDQAISDAGQQLVLKASCLKRKLCWALITDEESHNNGEPVFVKAGIIDVINSFSCPFAAGEVHKFNLTARTSSVFKGYSLPATP